MGRLAFQPPDREHSQAGASHFRAIPRRRDVRAGLRVRLRVKNRAEDYVLGNRIELPPILERVT